MKRITCILFIYLINLSIIGQNYYVSSSKGNDNNDGLTPDSAWKSLSKIESKKFISGETIFFKRGDIWNESLSLANLNGSNGNPIIFTAYGAGDKPVFMGSSNFNEWKNIGPNIWETDMGSDFVHDIPNCVNARTPDLLAPDDSPMNYLKITSVQNGKTQFTCSNLIGHPDIIGSKIQIRLVPFVRAIGTINGFDSSTGRITVSSNIHDNYKFEVGQTFWIQDHYNLLSSENEWFYNNNTRKLHIYSSKKPENIQVTINKGDGISLLNSQYVLIDNIKIINFNGSGIKLGSGTSYNILSNNEIANCKDNGIYLYATNGNYVQNNEIKNISNTGIIIEGASNNIIEENIIEDVYLLKNISKVEGGNNSGIYTSRLSINTIIRNNRVKNTGFNGISFFRVKNLVVDKNYVENTCLNMEDGGGIYGNNDSSDFNSVVTNNTVIGYSDFVSSNWDAMGIYLDDNSHDWIVTGNNIKGNKNGIFLHNTQKIILSDNKIYQSSRESVLVNNDNYGNDASGNQFKNNEVFIENKKYLPLKIHNKTDTFWKFLSCDFNKYYNPLSANSVEFQTIETDKDFSLLDWQVFSEEDSKSVEDALIWDENSKSQFVYNENSKVKIFILEGKWWDLSGIMYDGSITLEPYKSAILINQEILFTSKADAGKDQTICSGNSATLTASGGSVYKWSTGATTKSITVSPSATTTYSVTVSEGSVSDTDEVVVTVNELPIADAGTDVKIESGQSTTLTATGGDTYLWSNGATTASITVNPTATTTYEVTVNKNGCTSKDTVTVTVNTASAPPTTVTADAGKDQTICNGNSTTLTASGGSVYKWSTGATTKSITVSPATNTTYSVTVSEGSVSDTDEVLVTVNPLPIADAGSNKTIELGQSVELRATGGNTYLWSTGETTQSITVKPDKSTIYSVTVNQNGCSSGDSVQVTVNVPPPADANAGSDLTICKGESITLNGDGGATYSWSTGATTRNITVSPNRTTTYTLTANRGGTTSTDEVIVTVINCNLNNGVNNSVSGTTGNTATTDPTEQDDAQVLNKADFELTVYPNPTEGKLNVQTTVPIYNFNLVLMNINGNVIYSDEMDAAEDGINKEIDLSGFAKGVYLLQLYNAEESYVKKVIVI